MKPEIKQKWIDALRSGEYQQDVGVLKTEKGYCCLGVLADLYNKEHNLEWCKDRKFYCFNNVLRWADFPYYTGNELVVMNDEKGKSFLEIADYIEENL